MVQSTKDTANSTVAEKTAAKTQVSFFASLELAITLMAMTALTVLIGAWCPQESQVGREKVLEAFGKDMGERLIQGGIADIFHSPWFLFLIAMLTVNMVAVSFQRVFPKVRLLKHAMPFLKGKEILRMPCAHELVLSKNASGVSVIAAVKERLGKRGFQVAVQPDSLSLTGEYGKFGRLAATITHIGLLTLLAGVTVTSWTGFSGFQPVRLDQSMTFESSQHSKLWVGKLPIWSVRVDGTRRENYPTGEAKQWYSDLAVVDLAGKVLKKQQISVNNPLSYDGVDIYQSSWGIEALEVTFNDHKQVLDLQPMGKRFAAFLPLDSSTILIFSVIDQTSPMRLFAKRPEWEAPKLIAEIKPNQSAKLGNVNVGFQRVIPATGLQYKSDPGLPIVYVGFAFIICGVLLAAIPHRHVWAAVAAESDDELQLKNPGHQVLYIGGKSQKAKVGFEKLMNAVVESLAEYQIQGGEPSMDEEPVLTGANRESRSNV